ncbi:MAG: SprT-like domain-containing protein [Chromatiaceae bacterium]|nr:SprT-like domain-containing protein [Chromatiaceae bacterium]MBP8023846.1 SprT-like domain-containing protein [Chromatiaceae bacterium]
MTLPSPPPPLPLDRLIMLARSRTQELLGEAARHFGLKAPQAEIRFDLRGRGAGQVRRQAVGVWLVRYNPVLLGRHGEDFLARTVPHEVAHIMAFRRHGLGIQPHGPEWRAMMQLFGVAPERCHDFDVSGLQTRTLNRYPYQCGCRSHLLTSIRHHRILRGQRYLCGTCGQPLELAREGHKA